MQTLEWLKLKWCHFRKCTGRPSDNFNKVMREHLFKSHDFHCLHQKNLPTFRCWFQHQIKGVQLTASSLDRKFHLHNFYHNQRAFSYAVFMISATFRVSWHFHLHPRKPTKLLPTQETYKTISTPGNIQYDFHARKSTISFPRWATHKITSTLGDLQNHFHPRKPSKLNEEKEVFYIAFLKMLKATSGIGAECADPLALFAIQFF